tara:strand:- start:691 stop:945 length:255 start_codon:yes stop_codon:yes gene_type:complete
MRKPKAVYFKERYDNAIENNLSSKAAYYKSRLVQMGEWSEVKDLKDGASVKVTTCDIKGGRGTGLQRHEMDFGKGGESFVFYSM